MQHSSYTYAEEYLDTVIEKINKMEENLQKLQNESLNKNSFSDGNSSNSIASHEKRLIDLEEELRTINGRIDEVLYELKNLSAELDSLKVNSVSSNNINISKAEKANQEMEGIDTEKRETITSEDPNMKSNPSMKVLGVIKEEQENDNTVIEEANNIIKKVPQNLLTTKENPVTDKQLEYLAKDPSDIYKHAYNMLIQENFLDAEKYFNIFIGENPEDPLASNAYYWLGETFYVQKKFQKAAISFAKGYQKFPKGNKAIDQLFKLALTFINLGKNEDACAAFSKLEIEFPNASKRIKNRAKEYKVRAKC